VILTVLWPVDGFRVKSWIWELPDVGPTRWPRPGRVPGLKDLRPVHNMAAPPETKLSPFVAWAQRRVTRKMGSVVDHGKLVASMSKPPSVTVAALPWAAVVRGVWAASPPVQRRDSIQLLVLPFTDHQSTRCTL